MEQLAWQKQINFEVENNLVNENYRLGQAVRCIVKKDTESIRFAIKILESELQERTSIRK